MSITFSQALADCLASRGVTQQQLGARLGVAQNTVSRWIGGTATPEPHRVFEIERALDLVPGELSMYLGYLPIGEGRAPCSVPEAIREAPELEPYHREALLSVYRSFVDRSA